VTFRWPLIVAAALAVTGCANEVTWRQRAGLDYLVGKPEAQLTALIGPASRTWSDGANTYLAYAYNNAQWVQNIPDSRYPDSEVASAPWVASNTCTTTFRITGGVVTAWNLNGNACRTVPYPDTTRFANNALMDAEGKSVNSITPYPHNVYSDRSIVADGSFYSK
jgi:hypothetical protein